MISFPLLQTFPKQKWHRVLCFFTLVTTVVMFVKYNTVFYLIPGDIVIPLFNLEIGQLWVRITHAICVKQFVDSYNLDMTLSFLPVRRKVWKVVVYWNASQELPLNSIFKPGLTSAWFAAFHYCHDWCSSRNACFSRIAFSLGKTSRHFWCNDIMECSCRVSFLTKTVDIHTGFALTSMVLLSISKPNSLNNKYPSYFEVDACTWLWPAYSKHTLFRPLLKKQPWQICIFLCRPRRAVNIWSPNIRAQIQHNLVVNHHELNFAKALIANEQSTIANHTHTLLVNGWSTIETIQIVVVGIGFWLVTPQATPLWSGFCTFHLPPFLFFAIDLGLPTGLNYFWTFRFS